MKKNKKKAKQQLIYTYIDPLNNDMNDLEECTSFDDLLVNNQEEIYINPIHSRLKQLNPDGLLCFSLLVTSRMFNNFALYMQDHIEGDKWVSLYKKAIKLSWIYLLENPKIDFEEIIQELEDFEKIFDDSNEGLLRNFAEDAYIAIMETLQAFMGADELKTAQKISLMSIYNVADFYSEQHGIVLNYQNYKDNEDVQKELDWQWTFFRSLKNYDNVKELKVIMAHLKNDLDEILESNVGVTLNSIRES